MDTMDVAVLPHASLQADEPRPFEPAHPIITDADTDASVGNSNAQASSHEEDDIKGSDGWRRQLQSDASTASSRVTTPDPHLPGPLLHPIGLSLESSTKTPIPAHSSVMPRPPPSPASLDYRGRRLSDIKSKSSNGTIQQPSQFHPHNIGQIRVPPPPPPPNRTPTSHSVHHGHIPPPPPPPDNLSGEAAMRKSSGMPAPRGGRRQYSRDRRKSGKAPGQSASHRPRSDSSDTASSTFHLNRPLREASSESDSSSGEDPLAYRNARQFPPQLPAAPSHRLSHQPGKSPAANIAHWVSQYEKPRSPRRAPRGPGGSSLLSDDASSDDYVSISSEASSQGEIETLWQQLKEKRARLNEVKTEMAKQRKNLRDLRRKKDDADNAFMSVIRPILVSQRGLLHTSPSLLERRLTEMQRVRTDYHFLESNYEGLEVMLDEEEEELNRLETRFFSLLAAGRTRVKTRPAPRDADPAQDYPTDVPYELLGISRDGPSEELHPLYLRLTSAIGDLENAKEEYDDLFLIREQYEYDLELKKTTGKKTLDEMREFFEEYPTEELRKKESVNELEREVQRLKKLCEEKEVMRKHLSVRTAYALDPHIEYEDMDLDDRDTILAARKTLAHDRFPELLSQPEHVLAQPMPLTPWNALVAATQLANDDPEKRTRKRLATKEYAIDRLMQDDDAEGNAKGKMDFVNRWLLQELRISPLNALLLYSTFVMDRSLKIRDSWRWQCDVLRYWWQDSTMAVAKERPSNLITSNGSGCLSRLGTPPLSRAASDSGIQSSRFQHYRGGSSDAITVQG